MDNGDRKRAINCNLQNNYDGQQFIVYFKIVNKTLVCFQHKEITNVGYGWYTIYSILCIILNKCTDISYSTS